MTELPGYVIQLAFDKSDNEPLTDEEQAICEEWTSGQAAEIMKIDLTDPRLFEYIELYNNWKKEKAKVWKSLAAQMQQPAHQLPHPVPKQKNKVSALGWIAIAAACIAAIFIGRFFYVGYVTNTNSNKNSQVQVTKSTITQAIQPGGKKAELTLTDGTKKNLDALPTGIVANQKGIETCKQSDSQLVYTASNNMQPGAGLYNTLTAPNGGEYNVTLTDGTRIWVNAGSSLRYPISFADNERRVEVDSGEVYFEVAHNTAKPFKAYANGTEVTVFGTKFNMQVHPVESSVTTTLIEGKVQVQHGHSIKQLKPNQQVIVSGEKMQIRNVAISQVLAWKNGYINLEGENIESIMQQLHRWYNVNVIIKGTINANDLVGNIPKTSPLKDIINVLNNSNINARFHLEGATLIAEEKD